MFLRVIAVVLALASAQEPGDEYLSLLQFQAKMVGSDDAAGNTQLALLQQRANLMVDESMNKSNASQRILDLMQMVQDMFTNLENFDTCLNAEPEYKILGGVDFVARLISQGKSVGEMFDAISSKYITRAIVSGAEWIVEELDIEIEKIKQGLLEPPKIDMLGGLESLVNGSMMVTMIDEAWSRAERLYERPGWLPLKCSFAFVFGTSKQPLIDIVVNFVPHVILPAIDMIGQAMIFVFNEAMETLGQMTGTATLEYKLAKLTGEAVGESCMDLLDKAADDLARARFQEDAGIIVAVEKEFAAPMKAETVGMIIASIISQLLNEAFHTLSTLTFQNIIQMVLATCRGFTHVGLHFLNYYSSIIPFVGSPLLAPFTTFVDVVQGQFYFYASMFINQAILDVFAFFTNKLIIAQPIILAIKTFNFIGGLGSLSLNAAMRLTGIPGTDSISWLTQGMGLLQDAVGGIASWAMPNIADALNLCSGGRQAIARSTRMLSVDMWLKDHILNWGGDGGNGGNSGGGGGGGGDSNNNNDDTTTGLYTTTTTTTTATTRHHNTDQIEVAGPVSPKCTANCGSEIPRDVTGTRITPSGDDSSCMEYDESTKHISVVPCVAGSKQIWFYDEERGTIKNGDGSLCLQPAIDGSGAVSAGPCNSNNQNQKWKLDGGYIISHGGDCVTFVDDGSVTLQDCPQSLITNSSGSAEDTNSDEASSGNQLWLLVSPLDGLDDGDEISEEFREQTVEELVCKKFCYNKKHGGKSWTVKEKGSTPKCWWNSCGGCPECEGVSLTRSLVETQKNGVMAGNEKHHADRKSARRAARQARRHTWEVAMMQLTNSVHKPVLKKVDANQTFDRPSSYSSLWPVSSQPYSTDLLRTDTHVEKSRVQGIIANKRCISGAWKYDKGGGIATRWHTGSWGIPYAEFYWQHGWHYSGAGGCEYGNTLALPWQWWCPTQSDTLAWGQSNDPFRIAKCWDDENWLDNTLMIVDNFPDVLNMIASATECIDGLTGGDAIWKMDSMMGFWIERIFDPVKYFTDLFSTYINPTFDALVPWSLKAMKAQWEQSLSVADAITGPTATWLTNEWGVQQLEQTWNSLMTGPDGLVHLPGMGVQKCLIETVGQPIFDSSKDALGAIGVQLLTAPAKALDAAVDALMDFMINSIDGLLANDRNMAEGQVKLTFISDMYRDIRYGVMDACLNRFNSFSVQELVAGFDPNFDEDIDIGGIMVKVVDTFMNNLADYVVTDVVSPISQKTCDVVVVLLDFVLHAMDAISGSMPYVYWGAIMFYINIYVSWGKNVVVFIGHKLFTGALWLLIKAGTEFFKPIVSKLTRLADFMGDALTEATMDGPFAPVMQTIQGIFATAMKIAAGPQVWKCQHILETLSDSLATVDGWTYKPEPTPAPTPAPTTPDPTPAPTSAPTPSPTPAPPATIHTGNWWGKFDHKGWSTENGGITGLYRNDCNGLNCLEEVQYASFPLSSDCYDAGWWGSFDHKGWSQCNYGYFITGLYRNDCNELYCLEAAKCCKQEGQPGYIYAGTGDACTGANWWGSFDHKGWSKCPPGKALSGFYRNDCNGLNCIEEARCCPYE